jgi:hypothetical protein
MRAVMKQHNIPKNWWCHTLEHCTEVENMLPTKKQNNKAPYFVWTRKVPDVSKLRVYGCLAYAHLDGKKLPKLSPRAVPCVYLGNAPNGEGYKLFSWTTFSYIVCRSVEFYEGESAFGIKEARSYMNELDPELLYELLEDEEEENDTDGSSTDSFTDSSLYFFIDCMGVKPCLTANFVQKFAKKYSRLVGDVTFQDESNLRLTFWFDCGGRTGCQMGSVFDALWVEYS